MCQSVLHMLFCLSDCIPALLLFCLRGILRINTMIFDELRNNITWQIFAGATCLGEVLTAVNGWSQMLQVCTPPLSSHFPFIPILFPYLFFPHFIFSLSLSLSPFMRLSQVAVKGQTPIINGDFHKRVIVDDSFWTIEDGELGESA